LTGIRSFGITGAWAIDTATVKIAVSIWTSTLSITATGTSIETGSHLTRLASTVRLIDGVGTQINLALGSSKGNVAQTLAIQTARLAIQTWFWTILVLTRGSIVAILAQTSSGIAVTSDTSSTSQALVRGTCFALAVRHVISIWTLALAISIVADTSIQAFTLAVLFLTVTAPISILAETGSCWGCTTERSEIVVASL
jgi:hypothetical protein